MRHAVVMGASGVIGSAIAQRLRASGEWEVTGVTRSGESVDGHATFAVDLTDPTSVKAATASLAPVTHLFYAAYVPRPTRFEEIEPNRRMLSHAIDLAEAGSCLKRVVLTTGGKYYGVQWGAIKTPARETDARHLAPNFYYQQQDLLEERGASARWDWTNLIPPYVTGFSARAPMNLSMAIGVLASLSRELKLPLRFPGPAVAWTTMHHIADADHVADAAAWAADSANAGNQLFNVANGDPGRWCHTWQAIADHFGLTGGDPLPMPLSMLPSAFQGVWSDIAARHRLVQPDLNALVDWKWAEYMFNTAFANDVVLELGKIRRAGFHPCVDTEVALTRRFEQLRSLRLIP